MATPSWDPSHRTETVPMILCNACRQKPSVTALWEATPSSRSKQIMRPTAKHWVKLEESCGRVRGRIGGHTGDKNYTRRATESTNLGPWETGAPTKEHTWIGPRFRIQSHHAGDVDLRFWGGASWLHSEEPLLKTETLHLAGGAVH